VTQEVWAELYAECARILGATSLQDLADRARRKQDMPLAYSI
jgi:hypothetical protein